MITSGYLIGQIIDEFALLGDRIKLRNRLHLFDLTIHVENFFKDIMDIIDDSHLVNLNSIRSNEPGLDLGDKEKKIAYQITSDKTGQKVIHTLEKITAEHLKVYNQFKVLIVGEKQQTYGSVTNALKARFKSESDVDNKIKSDADDATKEENINGDEVENSVKIDPQIQFDIDTDIIDLTDLARMVVGLPLDKIQRLNRYIQDQMANVRIELEVPDENGKYETSAYDKWEPLPVPKLGDGYKFAAWEESLSGDKSPSLKVRADQVKDALEHLSQRLYTLPRITREFFATLHERAVYKKLRFDDNPSILLPAVLTAYAGAQTHLDLLEAEGLIEIDGEQTYENPRLPAEVGLRLNTVNSEYLGWYFDFVKDEGLSYRSIFGKLDFSDF